MRTESYYSIEIKNSGFDESYYSLQTHFDTRGDAIKFALKISSNYLVDMKIKIDWHVKYCYQVPGGKWCSRVVARNTDPVELGKYSNDNKKGQE